MSLNDPIAFDLRSKVVPVPQYMELTTGLSLHLLSTQDSVLIHVYASRRVLILVRKLLCNFNLLPSRPGSATNAFYVLGMTLLRRLLRNAGFRIRGSILRMSLSLYRLNQLYISLSQTISNDSEVEHPTPGSSSDPVALLRDTELPSMEHVRRPKAINVESTPTR